MTPSSASQSQTGSDVRIQLPRITGQNNWPAARFQIRNWMRMADILDIIDADIPAEQSAPWKKKNEKIFGIIASHCEGEALTIAQSLAEGNGRGLFEKFDLLWRSKAPAALLGAVRTITESKLTDPNKFEVFIAERTSAAQRLADGGMALPGPFLALCLLLGLSQCSALSGLLSVYAIEEAGPQEVTVEKVITAARQMLTVRPVSQPPSDLQHAKKREQVLQARVKELEAQASAVYAVHDGKGGKSKGKGSDNKKKESCYYCEKIGHRAHECRRLHKEFNGLPASEQEKWRKYIQAGKAEAGIVSAPAARPATNTTIFLEDLL